MSYLWHTHGEFLDAVDLAAGSLACLALWQRRSHPVGVFVLAFAAGSISRWPPGPPLSPSPQPRRACEDGLSFPSR